MAACAEATAREVPGGVRWEQGRVVLSELRLLPGPTHSVFDVLAALMHRWAPEGRMGVLGFAAGGVVAPLRALGCTRHLEAVDLDPAGHELFRRWCPGWAREVDWSEGDAARWLEREAGTGRQGFAALVEDLSEPRDGDVHKPEVSRVRMPRLIRAGLVEGGVAVFNVVPDGDGSWPGLGEVRRLFPAVAEVRYEGYLNRTWLAARRLPGASVVGRWLQSDLRAMGSRLAGRTSTRGLRSAARAWEAGGPG